LTIKFDHQIRGTIWFNVEIFRNKEISVLNCILN